MVLIDSVSFGEASVDGKTYYSDLVVWWDGKVEFIPKNHRFGMSELLSLLRKKPDVVVLGTGFEQCVQVLEEVEQEVEDRRLLFFAEKTQNAFEIFNAMVNEGKKAVACVHVTS